MKRSDDEMILFFYGEHDEPEKVERDLASDPELAQRYEQLRRELGALDTLGAPEPRAGIEGRMWARVSPSLARPSRRLALPTGWPGWAALAAGVSVIALLGFLSGRISRPEPDELAVVETFKALAPEARERVLQAALADHLDSSQRFLLEVENGAPNLDQERLWAESLLSANRLYRRAAERAGQRRVAAVLEELEPLLAQLANSPDSFNLDDARRRIEHADLLFKVRITRSNLKETS
jgi:hypothetical protein